MRRFLILVLLTAALPVARAAGQDSVTICHATGNPQNPYVPLTLNNAGVLEHVNHEDDLVPAPAEGCPATTVVDPEDTPTPTATPAPPAPTPTATATPTPEPSPTRTPRPPQDDDDGGDSDGGGVQGGGGSSGAPTLTPSPPNAQPAAADTRHLPMTGAEMWLIGAFGVGFLLSGTGLRLLSPAARPPGPSGH